MKTKLDLGRSVKDKVIVYVHDYVKGSGWFSVGTSVVSSVRSSVRSSVNSSVWSSVVSPIWNSVIRITTLDYENKY